MTICCDLKTTTALDIVFPGETIHIVGVGSFSSVVEDDGVVVFTKACLAKDLMYRNEILMQYRLYMHAEKPITLLDRDGEVVLCTHSQYNVWLDTLLSEGRFASRLCASCDLVHVCNTAFEYISKKDLTLKDMRGMIKTLTTLEVLEVAKVRSQLENGESVPGYALSIKQRKGVDTVSVVIHE